MEMVIQPVVSASIKFLLERIASSDVASYLTGKKDSAYDKLLQKLKRKFLSLSAVLSDAEQKQISNKAVKEWLGELQDAVDDAKDLFDEIEYDALKLKVEAESRSGKSKVRNLFSTVNFGLTDQKRKTKMEEILAKLKDFEKESYALKLEEGVMKIQSWRPPSTSLIDDSEFYGRDDEKRYLKEMLLSDEVGRGKICVIPIVGMGGIGKTSLAQALYNDEEINNYFPVKAWVCVSDESDVCRVTKTVVEAVTRDACTVENLDVLQGKIQERLKGNKFLIVLDDVWTENDDFWDSLRMPFKDGAPGSKIIVTTRSEKVASIMGTVEFLHLKELNEEACLKLFAKYATGNEEYTINLNLERIGRKLIKKCKCLPLAVKSLGGLLRSTHVGDWENIAESDILDLPVGEEKIIPALRLSYHYLPSHLKQCFAYCSLFPKDYNFEKDELVLRWMAEGLLEPQKGSKMEMEDVGNDYFNDLVSRSFFQHSSIDGSLFVMHDLMVDLVIVVSRKMYFLENKDKLNDIGLMKQARHITYDKHHLGPKEIVQSVSKGACLRTFSPLTVQYGITFYCFKETPVHDLLKLDYLRYLSLNGYKEVKQLPKSIGNLRHLRYLDLSGTCIKELPKSLCMLYNLQTLKLSNCDYLTKLPKNFHHLINLRYLDVDGSRILVITPKEISKLKSLRRLIGLHLAVKDDGATLRDLAELSNLSGRLSICDLQNAVDDAAGAAMLREKKYVEELNLRWSDEKANVSEHERDVLDQLLPNTTLKKLDISNYGGRTFPNWLGDQSFCNLVGLTLSGCKYCETLPPLGQLPSLKTLWIFRFDAIETVGLEFYGTSSPVVKPFPSLESLAFISMSKWMKWSMPTENVVAFPQLKTLGIEYCNRLTGDLPCVLPSLIQLSISHCSELVGFHHTYVSLQNLSIFGNSCRSIRSVSLDSFPNIRNVLIEGCENLESFSLCESLKYLSSLYIDKCPNFTFSPDSNLRCPILTELQLENCEELKLLPDQLDSLRCPILTKLKLLNCEKLKLLPDQLDSLLPSLRNLEISNCPELELSPRSRLPSSLHELLIRNCEKYVASRKNWNLEALPILKRFTIQDYQGEDMESFPEQGLLPTTLTYLRIQQIDCLKSLDGKGFQQLTSLETLIIRECPKLETLPEEGLPTSLAYLIIIECPLLKQKCQRNTGEYWNKIARIPRIEIDSKEVQH